MERQNIQVIKCKICNKVFKSITNTHLKSHNISMNEYIKLYGQVNSFESNKKRSLALKGKTYEEIYGSKEKALEESTKRGKSNKGRIVSQETREKQRIAQTGKKHPHSEETKAKIGIANSISLKGRKIPKEVKEKRLKTLKENGIIPGKWNIGKKHSPETKRKQRILMIDRIEKKIGKAWNNFNPDEIVFFKKFDNIYKLNGIYAPDQYKIKELGYFLDYINFDKKLIIEYDEPHHYRNGKLKEKDVIRQKEIQEFYPDFTFKRVVVKRISKRT